MNKRWKPLKTEWPICNSVREGDGRDNNFLYLKPDMGSVYYSDDDVGVKNQKHRQGKG